MENTEISSSNDSWRKSPTQYRQYRIHICLVVWNMFYFPWYMGSSFPLTFIFFREVQNHQPDSIAIRTLASCFSPLSWLSGRGDGPLGDQTTACHRLHLGDATATWSAIEMGPGPCNLGGLRAALQLRAYNVVELHQQVLPCITYVWLAWYQQIWGSHPMKIWLWDKQMFFSATHMVILSEKSVIKPRHTKAKRGEGSKPVKFHNMEGGMIKSL